MSQPRMPSPQDKEAWIACIKARAKTEIPALLRQSPGECVTVANPVTPLPDIANIPTHHLPYLQRIVRRGTNLPETGGIERIRDTAMIPAVKLLWQAVDVRETRELVSTAIHWFWQKYGCLPDTVGVSPMRYLAITRPDYFAVDCEDLGGYTVRVENNVHLSVDVVELKGIRWLCEEIVDSYL